MSEAEVSAGSPVVDVTAVELRKEAFTMALYVSVCLLAALAATAESSDRGHVEVLALVWGTTLGLALAHLFAFRLSARLVGTGSIDRHDMQISLAQLVGAGAVAVLCSVLIVPLPADTELDAARYLLAGFIAVVAYLTARSSGTSRRRAVIYGVCTLAIASVIAVTKNVLVGH